jgi:hypothetical protein
VPRFVSRTRGSTPNLLNANHSRKSGFLEHKRQSESRQSDTSDVFGNSHVPQTVRTVLKQTLTHKNSIEVNEYLPADKPDAVTIRQIAIMNKNRSRFVRTPNSYFPSKDPGESGILNWERMPQKSCYLDDVMKMERKKVGPNKYSHHNVWTSVLNNSFIHGSNKKGKTFYHDRVLES